MGTVLMVDVVWGVIALLIGASVGSFLNVVADRLPSGSSLVHPRSCCDTCKRALELWELVPVISYLLLRGKCRNCKASIPLRFTVVEVATSLLFVLVFLKFGMGIQFFVLASAVSLLIVLSIIGLEHRLILNKLIFPAIAILIVLAPFWSELGISRSIWGISGVSGSFLSSVVAGGGAFFLFLVIIVLFPAGMGGGDVKMAGAVGLLVGFPHVLLALWLAVISGGLVAILLLVSRKRGRKDAVPFGPFLALGACIVMMGGTEIVDWYRTSVSSLAF